MKRITVSSGVTSSGLHLYGENLLTVSPGGTIVDTQLYKSSSDRLKGGTAMGTVLHNTAIETVLAGGTATGTIAYGSATQVIELGGQAIGTDLFRSSTQVIDQGGLARDTLLSHSATLLIEGGKEIGLTGLAGGEASITAGGILDSASIFAEHLAIDGGLAESVSVRNGLVTVASGSLTNFQLTQDQVEVSAGGILRDGTFHEGVLAQVSSGGSVSDVNIREADLAILAGATVTSASANKDGILALLGSANIARADNLGQIYVLSGGTITSATIASGGTLFAYGSSTEFHTKIQSGGLLVNLTNSGASETGTFLLAGGRVDFAALTFEGQARATYDAAAHRLTVQEGTQSAHLILAGDYSGVDFELSKDASGGTKLLAVATTPHAGGTAVPVDLGREVGSAAAGVVGVAVAPAAVGADALAGAGYVVHAPEAAAPALRGLVTLHVA